MNIKICVVLFLLLLGKSNWGLSQAVKSHSLNIPDAVYAAQKDVNWGWAACNQMVLNTIGVPETQESQVIKLFGALKSKTAGPNYDSAKRALGGIYTTSSGQKVTVLPIISYKPPGNQNDLFTIINHINTGIPVIMSTTEHGMVCVGLDYIRNGLFFQITRLRLIDPLRPGEIITTTMSQFIKNGLIGFMTVDVR